MLSRKCKYAIRAVLYLAVESSEKGKIGINEIAKQLKIPTPFLGKILQELVRKSIISSSKGPKGGFFLTPSNKEIPIIKIIEIIDGLAFFNTCGLGLEVCSEARPCPIHHHFKIARDQLQFLFETKNIKELSEDIRIHDLFLVR